MDRKEYYHIAKLSLFNVRLLSDVEAARPTSTDVEALVSKRATADAVAEPVNLIHQATFLGHGYIVVVWLWEHFKPSQAERETFVAEFGRRFDVSLNHVGAVATGTSARDLTKPIQFIRTIRNALAHSRVIVTDDRFVFENDDPKADDRAHIELTWRQFGEFIHACMFSLQALAYPD